MQQRRDPVADGSLFAQRPGEGHGGAGGLAQPSASEAVEADPAAAANEDQHAAGERAKENGDGSAGTADKRAAVGTASAPAAALSLGAENAKADLKKASWAKSSAALSIRSRFENLVRANASSSTAVAASNEAPRAVRARASLSPPKRKLGAAAQLPLSLLVDWWVAPAAMAAASSSSSARFRICGTEHSSFTDASRHLAVPIEERLGPRLLSIEGGGARVKLVGGVNRREMARLFADNGAGSAAVLLDKFSEGIPEDWAAILSQLDAPSGRAGPEAVGEVEGGLHGSGRVKLEGSPEKKRALAAATAAGDSNGGAPPAKRGRGRPRKVQADANGAPVIPVAKRGPGRPRKVPLADGEQPPAKRGRGRPKKVQSDANGRPVTPVAKRGPGRPKKVDSASAAAANGQHPPPTKRGPGRPRKVQGAAEGGPVIPVAKRGPGRPRKVKVEGEGGGDGAVVKKRGPGRPRKVPLADGEQPPAKRGPGRPRKVQVDANGVPVTPVAKRGPGRPRKSECSHQNAAGRGGGEGGSEGLDPWSEEQVGALQRAQLLVDPTARNFWQEVAKHVRGKSADECCAQFYGEERAEDSSGRGAVVANKPSLHVRRNLKRLRGAVGGSAHGHAHAGQDGGGGNKGEPRTLAAAIVEAMAAARPNTEDEEDSEEEDFYY